MSKLGKKPIRLPKDLKAKIEGNKLIFNGPKGTKKIDINDKMFSTEISKENFLSLKPIKDKNDESMKRVWGMTRSLVNNAIQGVVFGYEKILEMTGVGYRAAIKGDVLNLQVGYSHDVNYKIPDGIKLSVEKQTIIKINGCDKQQVGKVASEIKSYRPSEPYKGKGINEKNQYILRKEGKKK